MPLEVDIGKGIVLPKTCGPRELADVWKLYCNTSTHRDELGSWSVSPDNIATLFEIAYSASHLKEEAKPIRCRLFIDSNLSGSWTGDWKIRFVTPIPITDAAVLKKSRLQHL